MDGMRWQLASFAALAMSGCYEESTIPCDNGVLCPSTLTCTENDPASGAVLCAEQADITACAEATGPRTPCTSSITDNGLCIDNVCVPCLGPHVFECRYDAWTRIPEVDEAELKAIWVESRTVVYAVGGNVLLRYDGTTWHRSVYADAEGALSGVWSKGSDLYVVARGGVSGGGDVFHNGVVSPQRAPHGLTSVFAAGPMHAVAVGNELTEGTFAGAMWTFDEDPGLLVSLNDVYGFDADANGILDDAIAVGDNGTVRHRPAGQTLFSDLPGPNMTDQLLGIWGTSPTDYYVVGTVGMNASAGVIHHYSANGWSEEAIPDDVPAVNAIWGTSDQSTLYAVGIDGLLLRRSGGAWERLETPTTAFFQDVSGSERDAYAVTSDGSIWRIAPR